MSNKVKPTTTKKEGKSALAPKLRFPGFRDAEGWNQNTLSEVAKFFKGKGISKADVTANGRLECIRYGELYTRYSEVIDEVYSRTDVADADLFLSQRNDVIIPASRETKLDIAKASCVMRDQIALGGDLNVIRTEHNGVFLSYYFNGPQKLSIAKIAQGDTVVHLYPSQLEKLVVATPCSSEQQKIADCLTSVDELIASHARKLDALKTHKKGLIQKLFPREGETLPRLCFPEFRDAGAWEEKPFSELCDIKHGYAFEGEFFSNEGNYVLLTPGNFFEQGGYRDQGAKQKYYTGEIPRDYVLNYGDLLVAMTEQAAGLLGSPILVPESDKFLHNQRLGLVTRKPGVAWTNEFFFHVFNTQAVRKAIHDTASGAKVRHTSPTKIGEVVVSFPTVLLEQQRIASCLSSLDDLIAAQTQKLEALKTHKKGLMQQLFPSPEVEA